MGRVLGEADRSRFDAPRDDAESRYAPRARSAPGSGGNASAAARAARHRERRTRPPAPRRSTVDQRRRPRRNPDASRSCGARDTCGCARRAQSGPGGWLGSAVRLRVAPGGAPAGRSRRRSRSGRDRTGCTRQPGRGNARTRTTGQWTPTGAPRLTPKSAGRNRAPVKYCPGTRAQRRVGAASERTATLGPTPRSVSTAARFLPRVRPPCHLPDRITSPDGCPCALPIPDRFTGPAASQR